MYLPYVSPVYDVCVAVSICASHWTTGVSLARPNRQLSDNTSLNWNCIDAEVSARGIVWHIFTLVGEEIFNMISVNAPEQEINRSNYTSNKIPEA